MPITTDNISPEELQRLMAESGMEHKLPDDFIPFTPGVQQRQQANSPASNSQKKKQRSKAKKAATSSSHPANQASSSSVSAGSLKSFAPGRSKAPIQGPRIRELGSDEEADQLEESQDDDDLGSLGAETIEVRPGQEARLHGREGDEEELSQTTLYIFDTIIWTMPFGFLLLLLGILIKQQYAMEPTFLEEVVEQASNFPCTSLDLLAFMRVLFVFVYFTLPSSQSTRERIIQASLFAISLVTGSSFLYTLERSEWLTVVRRTPPLGTLWIFTVVRLRLPLAVLNLALVYGFTRYAELELKVF